MLHFVPFGQLNRGAGCNLIPRVKVWDVKCTMVKWTEFKALLIFVTGWEQHQPRLALGEDVLIIPGCHKTQRKKDSVTLSVLFLHPIPTSPIPPPQLLDPTWFAFYPTAWRGEGWAMRAMEKQGLECLGGGGAESFHHSHGTSPWLPKFHEQNRQWAWQALKLFIPQEITAKPENHHPFSLTHSFNIYICICIQYVTLQLYI